MSSVDESIVREWFEANGFLVCQRRKHGVFGRQKTVNEEVDLVVMNPRVKEESAIADFVITSENIVQVRAAMVAIKGWHTETISPGVLANHARSFRIAGKEAIAEAQRLVGNGGLLKVVVVPGLPRGARLREQTIAKLRELGLDAVIAFPSILQDLVERVKVNRNYQKSDVLEMLRLLKNYGLIKDPQLELRFASRKAAKPPRNKG
jgi:post-segregation antitoxin (ccd killing protein)